VVVVRRRQTEGCGGEHEQMDRQSRSRAFVIEGDGHMCVVGRGDAAKGEGEREAFITVCMYSWYGLSDSI